MGVFLTSKINKKTISLPAQYSYAKTRNGEDVLACKYWTDVMDITWFWIPSIFYDTYSNETHDGIESPCRGLKIRPILVVFYK